jgi:thiol-disulfide isomerase/thioredoxin
VQQIAQQVSQQFQAPNANKDSINQVLQNLNGILKNNFFSFLKEQGGSEVAAFVVYSSIMNERSLTLHVADTLYQFLHDNARTGFYGKELSKTMNKLKSVEPGYIAPDFTLADSNGKAYTLRKIKSKYILLDFWASWCGPCKAEIPYMKKAYEKFHSKGFEIVSVSIDAKKDAWLAALKQFQMPWIHLLEADHIVSDLYHFPTIPKTLLMDDKGTILAADLRGELLDKKLEELLP